MNFCYLGIFYKAIQWIVLILAPTLWIGLISMAVKGRGILYWWYPNVSLLESYQTNNQNLPYYLEMKHQRECHSLKYALEAQNCKLQKDSTEMNRLEKVLQDKHVHSKLYNLSEFVLVPDVKYMLISTQDKTHCQIDIHQVHLFQELNSGVDIKKPQIAVLEKK